MLEEILGAHTIIELKPGDIFSYRDIDSSPEDPRVSVLVIEDENGYLLLVKDHKVIGSNNGLSNIQTVEEALYTLALANSKTGHLVLTSGSDVQVVTKNNFATAYGKAGA